MRTNPEETHPNSIVALPIVCNGFCYLLVVNMRSISASESIARAAASHFPDERRGDGRDIGFFTRRGYEAQLAYAYRIQNKQIRDIVLDFMLKPAATAFGQPATQSWLASPGSGWKSHHAYPGGLSIHNLEWVEVASAWVDTYEKVYGVKLEHVLAE